jgi:CBS domain-containing protein
MSADAARGGGTDTVTRAVVAFLRRYPPFDDAGEEALLFLAARLSVGYFEQGTRILAPEHGEPGWLYIVQAGVVSVAPADTYHLPHGKDGTLGAGECFSVGALLEHRPVGASYVAASDVFCYQLPAADFQPLLDRSPRLREFATSYLGSLLRESRRLLSMHHASLAAEQQAMGRALRSIITRPAVACAPQATIGEALRAMQQARIGSIIVVAPSGAAAGILTRHDILDRVALPERSLGDPISSVMTPDPVVLPAEASAYDAALLVATHGFRHVPVVDAGRVIGVVTERDLFALQRLSIRSAHRGIANASALDALQQAARDIRALARTLIAEGAAAEPLTLIISTLNDALTRRILDLERGRHRLEDITWGWLGFGSEGRYEQTISTDQDNGLIFAVPPGQTVESVRGRLLPFAQSVNQALHACGYPLCKGNIMAGNPAWCLSLEEWLRRFDGWISNTDPQALLDAAIFFDLRLLHGNDALAAELRERLQSRAAGTPRFLRQMAEQAVAGRPPLGVLHDFVTEASAADGRPALDLKKSGTRLFVDAARVIGLAAGVAHTSTAERLRQGGAKLGIGAQETSAFTEAFFFIQMLRLRRQSGPDAAAASNRIEPDALNEVDRRMLKEALRQARKLQHRLELDYQL